tara:strand:+ start:5105 stop:5548 length:444 start_codon:yes stop_codon:yes gene_type:complete
MTSTSSKYDECNTKYDFVQCYERPNQNIFQTYKYQHEKPKRNQFGLVGGNEVSVYCKDLIGLESDLLGLNKYKNANEEHLVNGSVCKDDNSFRKKIEDVNAQLKHLDNSQMIDYKSYNFQNNQATIASGLTSSTTGAGLSEAFNLLR